MKKLILTLCLISTLLLCCVACDQTPSADPSTPNSKDPVETVNWELVFDGDTFTCPEDAGVKKEGDVVLLTRAGTYSVSGTLTDGQLCVRIAKTEKITLVLNGFTASCSTSAPLYIESADKVNVVLADGTTNTLTDAASYVFDGIETKPNACLYSSEDITFKGNGKLIINANYNNGIGSKNDLEIEGGTFEIVAVKNALKGNDSVTITNGDILIKRCTDGIKTDATEAGRGILTISGGTIEVHAEDDGLQASQEINVTGGSTTIEALGKIVNCDGTTNITEGCLIEK